MALYKRGDVWWYEFVFNGQRIRESTQVANRRVAEQIEAARRTELAKGEVGIKRRKAAPTLREFEDRFLEAIHAAKGEKTAKWYKSMTSILLAHEPLANASLDDIDEAAVNGYVQHRSRQKTKHKQAQRTISPASINRELATLRRMMRLAHEWQLIVRVPRIRLLAGEKQREFILNKAAETDYLASCPPVLADIATFLIDTGFRLNEALSLELAQIRLDGLPGSEYGIATVLSTKAKGKRTRHVPLTARAAKILERWAAGRAAGYVFHDGAGNPLIDTSLDAQHRKVRTLLKLPAEFVLHSLRHTFGTRLGETGADAFTIMRLMGHASVTTSQRYVHPTPEAMEIAVRRMERAGVEMHEVPTNSPTVPRKRKLVVQ